MAEDTRDEGLEQFASTRLDCRDDGVELQLQAGLQLEALGLGRRAAPIEYAQAVYSLGDHREKLQITIFRRVWVVHVFDDLEQHVVGQS